MYGWPLYQFGTTPSTTPLPAARIGAPVAMLRSTPMSVCPRFAPATGLTYAGVPPVPPRPPASLVYAALARDQIDAVIPSRHEPLGPFHAPMPCSRLIAACALAL